MKKAFIRGGPDNMTLALNAIMARMNTGHDIIEYLRNMRDIKQTPKLSRPWPKQSPSNKTWNSTGQPTERMPRSPIQWANIRWQNEGPNAKNDIGAPPSGQRGRLRGPNKRPEGPQRYFRPREPQKDPYPGVPQRRFYLKKPIQNVYQDRRRQTQSGQIGISRLRDRNQSLPLQRKPFYRRT